MSAQYEETDAEKWFNTLVWMSGCDLEVEERQAREEGRDLLSFKDEFRRLIGAPKPFETWHSVIGGARDAAWLHAAGELIDRVQSLPYRADFPYHEPSDLEGIRAARPSARVLPQWRGSDSQWLEQLHGGLLGRIAGCLLGKPVEGWRRAGIEALCGITGNWPIADYFTMPSDAQQNALDPSVCPDHIPEGRRSWTKGFIDGMVEDDDINYTTIGFAVVQKYGKDFTPYDTARYWCDNLPILHTCTAERVAYRNFVNNIVPPLSAGVRNPYREWIGAQIRADYFGYANPGNPGRAAEWAWRDACISHTKNGIYGEMWVAAMLAAAYVESDWKTVIRAGLAQIPEHCRLRADVQKVMTAFDEGVSYESVIDLIHAQWDETQHHDWCHTNSNAQIVVLGMLYGEDDYEKTITRAVMPGFDTDCNAATCGSLWGIRHGLSALPAKWTTPLNDHVRTGVHGYHDVKISKLAEDMVKAAIAAR